MRLSSRTALVIAAVLPLSAVARDAHAVSTTVVISELRTRGPNGAADEFIELHNVSAVPQLIGGFVVRRSSAAGATFVVVTIPAATTLLPGGYWLITNSSAGGYSGSVPGNQTYTTGITDEGGVALLDGATIVDQVGFGAGSAYKEGAILAPLSVDTNQSYERRGGTCTPRTDTDANASDFVLNAATSHPQNFLTVCDPCTDVVCNSPPTSCRQTAGTCVAGACVYPASPAGSSCTDNDACTTGDACNGLGACVTAPVVCNTPPPTFCADANTSRSFALLGTCADPAGCSYAQTNTPCAFGCNGTTGSCSLDPCTGLACNTPPNDCFETAGSCLAGVCTYSPKSLGTQCSDANACTGGDVCNGLGLCAGALLPLDDANPCTLDACTPAGGITHTPTLEGVVCNDDLNACNGVSHCAAGVCANDVPAVVCNTPPAGGCREPNGTCEPLTGACLYAPVAQGTACDDANGCTVQDTCDTLGICLPGGLKPCVPPAPVCDDANTSRSFLVGTCNAPAGDCTFTSLATTCANGCDAATGLCAGDPCAGVVCNAPPTPCSANPGVCALGICTYPAVQAGTSCDDGAACTVTDTCDVLGVCAGTPVICNAPPPPTCVDAKTSRTAAAVGLCAAGACSYATVDVTCPAACNAGTGLCDNDPCAGVTCADPPDSCRQTNGTCTAGVCTYALKDAGAACDDGVVCTTGDACDVAGLCAGVLDPTCGAAGAAGVGGAAGAGGEGGSAAGAAGIGGAAGAAGGTAGASGAGGKAGAAGAAGGSGASGASGKAGAGGASGKAGAGGTAGKAGSSATAGTGGTGGTGGSVATAGRGGSSGGASDGSEAETGLGLEGGGCSCAVPRNEDAPRGGLLALLGLGFLAARRRKDRAAR